MIRNPPVLQLTPVAIAVHILIWNLRRQWFLRHARSEGTVQL
jgi:hypothetical protein